MQEVLIVFCLSIKDVANLLFSLYSLRISRDLSLHTILSIFRLYSSLKLSVLLHFYFPFSDNDHMNDNKLELPSEYDNLVITISKQH